MPIAQDEKLRNILNNARTIAVVGASEDPARDSYAITRFLLDRGYEVFPVNPKHETLLGVRCYPDLKSIPKKIDIVDVFRRPDAVVGVAEEAIEVGAKTLWLQLGVVNDEAARLAEERGLNVVMDHCIAVEHRRLIP